MTDYFEKLESVARGMDRKFTTHNNPFQIMTRIAEETGEVAQEVNHHERTGSKVEKYGEPSKASLASEIKDLMRLALNLAHYYGVEEELRKSIDASYEKLKADGFIEENVDQ